MTKKDEAGRKLSCNRCLHFHITHEPEHPYGCRAMAFKSKRLPCEVVRESSGLDCQLFIARKKKN